VQVFLEPGCHGFPPLLTGKGLGLLTASYINQGGKWRREREGGRSMEGNQEEQKTDVNESGKELRSGKCVDEVGNGMKKWESSGRNGKRVEEVVCKGDWRRRRRGG
jgi:hypothetical protein